MAVPEASKDRTGAYIAYTPASRVINLPLGSCFQPIRFMSTVYFKSVVHFSHLLCRCSCKKGMVDVNSLKQEMVEVAISLLNSVCFRCCTVLQQAKAFPCKWGILD